MRAKTSENYYFKLCIAESFLYYANIVKGVGNDKKKCSFLYWQCRTVSNKLKYYNDRAEIIKFIYKLKRQCVIIANCFATLKI